MSYPLRRQRGNQFFHCTVSLLGVAGSAQQLQVIVRIRSALESRGLVIQRHVSKREVPQTSVAVTLLPPVQHMLDVLRPLALAAGRNVRAVDYLPIHSGQGLFQSGLD